jgi:hypothetical protein
VVGVARRHWLLSALILLVLAGHLPFFASTLEDLDSFNFALGLHDFDPRKHQPHPPGYPVIIGLGKAARLLIAGDAPGPEADARALSAVSAIAGALLVVPLFVLYGQLERVRTAAGSPPRRDVPLGATAVAIAAPLTWFAMARPMSDMPGLALAVGAQALLVGAWVAFRAHDLRTGDRHLWTGAVAAALAVGARSQSVWLVAPILLLAFVSRRGAGAARAQLIAFGAATVAVTAWAVPLVMASGGIDGYLATLADQAGEDFAGVEMLWTMRSARVLVFALRYTLLDVWGPLPVGILVLLAVASGVVAVMWRSVPAALVAGVLWMPYFVFHLLFQETVTVRYALPVVPLLAWLAAVGLSLLPRPVLAGAVVAFVATSVTQTTAALTSYHTDGSPIARAMAAMEREPTRQLVAAHHVFARAFDADPGLGVPLTARRGREWLDAAARWRLEGRGPRWLLAVPYRTDIAVFDPVSRRVRGEYDWTFEAGRYIGGARPGPVVWYELDEQPGWILGEGWALTPELAGIANRDGAGLARGPIEAVVRRRPGRGLAIVGGRHLGASGEPAARLEVAIDGVPLAAWTVEPGPFLQVIEVPEGRLAGEGYARLTVTASRAGAGALPSIAIEQFDLQSEGTAVWAFGAGWHEAEFDRRTRRAFRWSSGRAELRILNVSRDTDLMIDVDSPIRYVNEPPTVTIAAGSRVLRSEPIRDGVSWRVHLPREVLEGSAGTVTITTDRTFRPSATGVADSRELGLRFFAVAVSR